MNKKKERDEFSDFDDLFAELDAEIRRIDAPVYQQQEQVVVRFERSKAARRPDLVPKFTSEIVWKREVIEAQIRDSPPHPISLAEFLLMLEQRAALFVWQGFADGEYIRGSDKEGYSYDPITAVARAALGTNYSLAVSDLAGAVLGLALADAKALAFVCWNPEASCLEKREAVHIRVALVEAIKRGLDAMP